MTEKEFNLKQELMKEFENMEEDIFWRCWKHNKEFIKRLKEEFRDWLVLYESDTEDFSVANNIIDKLAGDKLI